MLDSRKKKVTDMNYSEPEARYMLDCIQFKEHATQPHTTRSTCSYLAWPWNYQQNTYALFSDQSTNIHINTSDSGKSSKEKSKNKEDDHLSPIMLAFMLSAGLVASALLVKPIQASWQKLVKSHEIEPNKSRRSGTVIALTGLIGMVFLFTPLITVYSMLSLLCHMVITFGVTGVFFSGLTSAINWAMPREYGDKWLNRAKCQNAISKHSNKTQDLIDFEITLSNRLSSFRVAPPPFNPDSHTYSGLSPSAPPLSAVFPTDYHSHRHH